METTRPRLRQSGRDADNYNYFRDYDSAVGRYLESDPIGLRGGLNTYAYVGNNALTRYDKDGRLWVGAGAVYIGLCGGISYKVASDAYPNPRDDKKKHCYASCLLNQCTLLTFLPSFGLGYGFEVTQGLAGIGHYDARDIDANLYGILASYKGRCKPQCDVCPIK